MGKSVKNLLMIGMRYPLVMLLCALEISTAFMIGSSGCRAVSASVRVTVAPGGIGVRWARAYPQQSCGADICRAAAATRTTHRRHPATMSSSKTPEKRIRRRSNARRHGAATATKTAWLTRLAPAAAAALLVLTAVAGPPTGLMQAATAAGFGLGKENEKEPVMQALVQLPDDETNWKKFMDSEDQTTGASLLITATPEAGKSSVLGATVAMDKVRLPTMIQLFPANAMDGAKWPIDFDTEADYDVKVTVCAGGEREGLACKSPSLSGSGESMFVRQLEDVPEIAEMGGARVPAAVVLEPISR